MSTFSTRRMAEQLYDSGHALFRKGLYNEALNDLCKAEDAFRKLDERGHPFFPTPLANGLSGLANTLALSGRCWQKLGNYRAALTCYETSFINAKFEKKKVFRAFTGSLSEDLIACYGKVLEEAGGGRELLGRGAGIDTAFRFPYSLPVDLVPVARLYELAPGRYPEYRDFYLRERAHDAAVRRRTRTTDESTMKKISVSVWSILLVIWALYGFIVVKALVSGKK